LGGSIFVLLVPIFIIGHEPDGTVHFIIPLGLVVLMAFGGIGFLVTGLIDLDKADDELELMIQNIPYADEQPDSVPKQQSRRQERRKLRKH
jgi:hypothetical protein